MSPDQQGVTLVIALALVLVVLVGVATLWREWRKQWAIEDFIDSHIPENADVLCEQDEHPCEMPRWRGWRA